MEQELAEKQAEVLRLMAQLNNRDQLVHQLKENMENLQQKVEKRDQKRERSQ